MFVNKTIPNNSKQVQSSIGQSLNLVRTNNSKNMKESENTLLNDYFTNYAKHRNGNLESGYWNWVIGIWENFISDIKFVNKISGGDH